MAHATLSANTLRDRRKNAVLAATRQGRIRGSQLRPANAAYDSARQIAGCATDRARAARGRAYPPQLRATRGRDGYSASEEWDTKASAELREKVVRTSCVKA